LVSADKGCTPLNLSDNIISDVVEPGIPDTVAGIKQKSLHDRTVLTDIHIQQYRPDIIILNKQEKQAYLLDIAVPNSHNIT
jgi:hypothetical protein